jgi:hypothetical protein
LFHFSFSLEQKSFRQKHTAPKKNLSISDAVCFSPPIYYFGAFAYLHFFRPIVSKAFQTTNPYQNYTIALRNKNQIMSSRKGETNSISSYDVMRSNAYVKGVFGFKYGWMAPTPAAVISPPTAPSTHDNRNSPVGIITDALGPRNRATATHQPAPDPDDSRWDIWTVGCLDSFSSSGLKLQVLRSVLAAYDESVGKRPLLRNRFVGERLIQLINQRRAEATLAGLNPKNWDASKMWWEWVTPGDPEKLVKERLYGNLEHMEAHKIKLGNDHIQTTSNRKRKPSCDDTGKEDQVYKRYEKCNRYYDSET